MRGRLSARQGWQLTRLRCVAVGSVRSIPFLVVSGWAPALLRATCRHSARRLRALEVGRSRSNASQLRRHRPECHRCRERFRPRISPPWPTPSPWASLAASVTSRPVDVYLDRHLLAHAEQASSYRSGSRATQSSNSASGNSAKSSSETRWSAKTPGDHTTSFGCRRPARTARASLLSRLTLKRLGRAKSLFRRHGLGTHRCSSVCLLFPHRRGSTGTAVISWTTHTGRAHASSLSK